MKKENGFIQIIIVLVVVVIVAGFLILKKGSLSSIVRIGTPVPSASVDPTVGWKTYFDSKNIYSFKYPSQYGESTLTDNNGQESNFLTNLPDPKISVSWKMFLNTNQGALSNWANEYMKSSFGQHNISDSSLLTDGLQHGNGISFDANIVLTDGTNYSRVVFIPNGNNVIVFTLGGLSSSTDPWFTTFDEMIGTFKFTP